jgi:hypothetical protein
MAGETYTLKEMVAALAPLNADDNSAPLARQLRHWTNSGLLSPVGKRHTGTGTSRRYTPDEVRKAAILVELAHYRVPTTVLQDSFELFSEDWPKRPQWHQAITGTHQIFLYVTYNRDQVTYQLVPHDFRRIVLLPKDWRGDDPAHDSASAIVVNVTRVFSRLKL